MLEKITYRLEKLRYTIQTSMANNNINASGRTSASLEVVQYDGGVRLVSGAGNHAPMPTTEIGRPGGRVPKGFYHIIRDWSVDKGLTFSTESERGTFAYFTARKIADKGTVRNLNPVDVYSTLVREAVDDIKGIAQATIKEQINLNFK